MEYGKSSGMVNVDGTMMPDPSKHPELEAMVRETSNASRTARIHSVFDVLRFHRSGAR